LLRKLRLGKPSQTHNGEASEGCRGIARRGEAGLKPNHRFASYGSAGHHGLYNGESSEACLGVARRAKPG